MGLIKDFFLGRKVKFQDDKIGELSSRIKNDNPSIRYSWSGSHIIPGQNKETFFMLAGNSAGPYLEQLNSVRRIVDTRNDIIAFVAREVRIQADESSSDLPDWRVKYFLASVMTYSRDTKESGNKFEVGFEPLTKAGEECIGLIWNDGNMSEIEVY